MILVLVLLPVNLLQLFNIKKEEGLPLPLPCVVMHTTASLHLSLIQTQSELEDVDS